MMTMKRNITKYFFCLNELRRSVTFFFYVYTHYNYTGLHKRFSMNCEGH